MRTSTLSMLILLLAAVSSVSCHRQQEIRLVRKNLQQAVFASGYLVQEDEYVIAATADGIIRELTIREGDNIIKGQLLARIKSNLSETQLQEAQLLYQDASRNASSGAPQLSQIREQINLARIQLNQDKFNFERYLSLKNKNSVSQLEYEKAELQYKTSQSNLLRLEENFKQVQDALRLNEKTSLQQVRIQQTILNDYLMEADKDGTVLEVLKKKGELVRKGENIAKIGSGKYILKLFVAEDDITKLALGQEVIVQMNNYPDTTFKASLTRILPAYDQTEQSYIAEAVFRNPPELLLSGSQLQANIQLPGTRNVLVIPAAAVIRGKYVQLKDGTEKEIRTGLKLGYWVEVKSGLTERDVILLPEGKKKGQDG